MAFINQLLGKFFGKEEFRVLTLGLDASGKTSVLYRLKLGEIVTTIPTIGFNVESIEVKGASITMWDVGGCDKIRPLYRHYFANTQGLIWMVDSNDRERLAETSEELFKVLSSDEMRDVPLLVLANKQDLPHCMSVSEVTDRMGLNTIRVRKWHIRGLCATTMDRSQLFDAMEWLLDAMRTTVHTTPAPAPPPAAPSPATKSTGKAKITKEEKQKAREAEQEALFLKWVVPDKDTTEEFLAKLEANELEHFDHKTLLRMIWGYITTTGRRNGIKKVFEQLPKYYEKAPTIKNNETWTYFWIQIVHYAMEVTRNPSGDFVGFLFMNPLMLNQRMPYGYYSKKLILSADAQKNVVLPDKQKLPSIVPKAYNPAAHPPTTPNNTTPNNITPNNSAPNNSTSSANDVPTVKIEPPADATAKVTAQMEDFDLDDKLSDDEFLAAFESCNLHKWDHRTHIRVAWAYITKFGRKEGSNRIFKGIENFITNSKISRKTTFHVTMTFFWVQMVDIAIQSSTPNLPFDEFMKVNPQLMDGGLFLQYYKKETMLNNAAARKEFVLPDIKPLPTFIPKK